MTQRDLLAIVVFLQLYRPYLYGRQFTVRTDHVALQYSLRIHQPSGQLSRWLEVLQEYSFNVIDRKGTQHGNADGLSRLPTEGGRTCTLGSSLQNPGSHRGPVGCNGRSGPPSGRGIAYGLWPGSLPRGVVQLADGYDAVLGYTPGAQLHRWARLSLCMTASSCIGMPKMERYCVVVPTGL